VFGIVGKKKPGAFHRARRIRLESRGEDYFFCVSFILALAASHSALDMYVQPLPLQLFCPLQALLAVWQADLPLQEFTPSQ
jgi:hypothetical protein